MPEPVNPHSQRTASELFATENEKDREEVGSAGDKV